MLVVKHLNRKMKERMKEERNKKENRAYTLVFSIVAVVVAMMLKMDKAFKLLSISISLCLHYVFFPSFLSIHVFFCLWMFSGLAMRIINEVIFCMRVCWKYTFISNSLKTENKGRFNCKLVLVPYNFKEQVV